MMDRTLKAEGKAIDPNEYVDTPAPYMGSPTTSPFGAMLNEIKPVTRITVESAMRGGWIVYEDGHYGSRPSPMCAFSTVDELIKGLAAILKD